MGPRRRAAARRGVARLRPALLLVAALAGWALTAWLVAVWDVSVVEAHWRDRLVPVLTVAGGLGGAAVALLARRRPGAAADAGAVLAGVLIGGAT